MTRLCVQHLSSSTEVDTFMVRAEMQRLTGCQVDAFAEPDGSDEVDVIDRDDADLWASPRTAPSAS